MKKISVFLLLICSLFCLSAQNALNDKADNIIGTYSGIMKENQSKFKVKIDKMTDGTYRAKVIWVEKDKDDKGNKLLDKKNPDKKLRNVPIDQIVIFSGLKYNAKEKRWDDTKIYDPRHGIRANLEVWFEKDGSLRIRGSKFGISESVYWKKIQ